MPPTPKPPKLGAALAVAWAVAACAVAADTLTRSGLPLFFSFH